MSAVLRIDRNDHITQAHQDLQREFITALHEGPEATLQTPAYCDARSTVAFVVKDSLDGSEGDALLHGLLRIVSHAARSGDRLALSWLALAALEHANTHASDLAHQMEVDGHDL